MRKHGTFLLLLLWALLAAGAHAQEDTLDPEGEPAFLRMNLEAGFVLDPFVVSVIGGGDVDTSELGEGCAGFVNANPTVRVNYTGEADFLKAFFYSDHDPMLLVRTPDGEYLCNDDINPLLLDPSVELQNPPQGEYALWVGSFAEGQLIPGFLVFTANPQIGAGTFDPSALVMRESVPDEALRAERLPMDTLLTQAKLAPASVAAGDDPLTQEITAGGDVPAFNLDTGTTACTGFINAEPSLVFDWSGEAEALRVYFEGDSDATMLIRGPDGAFFCNDDADGSRNLNPLVEIAAPAEGQYSVYIGSFDPVHVVEGTLTITDDSSMSPVELSSQP